MLEFQEKRKIRRILYSRPSVIFLCILVLLLMRSVWSVYQKNAESGAKADIAALELAALRERKDELAGALFQIGTERGLEEEIRRKFQVAKPGESVVVIVDEASKKIEVQEQEKAWWQFWKW